MPEKRAGHPFVYGRPVRSSEFVDREYELRNVFNRLRNGDSTAVVGPPHIGKTSLLLQIADKATHRAYLEKDAQGQVFTLIDLHSLGTDYSPAEFWAEVLEEIHQRPGHATVTRRLKRAAEEGYSRHSLLRFFSYLAERNRRLVLLLDEFERLLVHPAFSEPSFFGLLRSLATHSGGLTLVIASRLSVAEMNEQGRGLLDVGSPFFNSLIELSLGPFDEASVVTLLSRAGDALSQEDRKFARHIAGRHPFLLQAIAAALVETTGEDRLAVAAQRFYEQIAFHFDDLWQALDDKTRTVALMLTLVEQGGRALGESFNYTEIKRIDTFGPELRKLAEQGLAERADPGWKLDLRHLLLWRGERWAVGSQAFAWWVRDVVIAESRKVAAYEEWLTSKRYEYFLTQGQWDRLTGMARKAPDWVVRGVGGLARSLFEELLRKK